MAGSGSRRISGRYIPALDGIRGVAILAVLATHAVPRLPNPGAAGYWYNQLLEAGAFGVDLFFVLSGFLITGILLDSRDAPGYFRNFYARRFLRLFPVYYLYLAFAALLLPRLHSLVHTHMPDYTGNWLWYLLYAANLKPDHAVHDPYLGHFWSLAVEEQFYLVWPLAVLLFRRRLVHCCLFAIAVSMALRVWLSAHGADWNTIYRVTPMRLDTLALGALGAIALRSGRWSIRGSAFARNMVVAGACLFLLCVVSARSTSWETPSIQTWGSFSLAAAFAGLVYLAAVPGSAVSRAFSVPWLRTFGKYSYTIYVIHVLIANHVFYAEATLAKRTGPLPFWADLICSLIVVALSLGVAAVSWKYYESPILGLKARFGGPSAT